MSSNEFVSGTSQVNMDLNLLSNGLYVCEIWSNGTQLLSVSQWQNRLEVLTNTLHFENQTTPV